MPGHREWRVESAERLRRHLGEAAPITREKVKPALDVDLRRFIEASPYVCVGTVDREGRCDVSPRADRLLTGMFGLSESDAQDLLDAYNHDEL